MSLQLKIFIQNTIQVFREGNFEKANELLRDVLKNDVNHADIIFQLGISFAQANRLAEAIAIFNCLLEYRQDDHRIPYNLGLIHSMQGNNFLALEAYKLSLKIKPDDVETLINLGSAYNEIHNYQSALEVLENSIKLQPNIPEAWLNRGFAFNNLALYKESIEAYREAIKHNPTYYQAWTNISLPLNQLKNFSDAIEACDKAITLKPDYAEAWSNKGISLNELKRYDEAIAHYNKAISLKPDYAEGYSNKGNTLNELKRYDEAIAHYDKAISLKPDYAEAWSNKGVTLSELKRYDEAIAHYDKAISLKPNYAEAWSNKGITLNELKRHEEAIAHFDKAISLKAEIDSVFGNMIQTKLRVCDWTSLTDSVEKISKSILLDEIDMEPLWLLGMTDDPLLHKKSAEIYVKSKYPTILSLEATPVRSSCPKIRIGYFSTDFKIHPVAILIAELIELHDKSRFETYAFSLSDSSDAMRERLHKSFDHFIDVHNQSDVEIAQMARNLEIDIAVDLNGFTQDSRVGIFSCRVAPIQVNYLGYPGSMGTTFMDYIIADKIIIPEYAHELLN